MDMNVNLQPTMQPKYATGRVIANPNVMTNGVVPYAPRDDRQKAFETRMIGVRELAFPAHQAYPETRCGITRSRNLHDGIQKCTFRRNENKIKSRVL